MEPVYQSSEPDSENEQKENEEQQMRRPCQVARAINGRPELNTLNIITQWELVEIFAPESDPDPLSRVEDEKDDDDDWELVEIFAPEDEDQPAGWVEDPEEKF